jgi:hypothetical protein
VKNLFLGFSLTRIKSFSSYVVANVVLLLKALHLLCSADEVSTALVVKWMSFVDNSTDRSKRWNTDIDKMNKMFDSQYTDPPLTVCRTRTQRLFKYGSVEVEVMCLQLLAMNTHTRWSVKYVLVFKIPRSSELITEDGSPVMCVT